MLVRAEVGPKLGPLDLPQGVLEIAVEKHHDAHLVHELAVHGSLDDSSAAAHEQRLAGGELPQLHRLGVTETLLALGGKNLRHRAAERTLHQTVGVDVRTMEERAEIAGEGRLAGAEKAHEEEVVAPLVDDVSRIVRHSPLPSH